jgi:hypothetical protein
MPSGSIPMRNPSGYRNHRHKAIRYPILAASEIAPAWLCLAEYEVLSSRATIHLHLAQMPTDASESSLPDNN